MNRFSNFFGGEQQEDEFVQGGWAEKTESQTANVEQMPKQEVVAKQSTPKASKEQVVEKPSFVPDASKPYAGLPIIKPKLDQAGIDRNNRTIKTQGLVDAFRLIAEGIGASMGADIERRGANKAIAKAEADNQRLMDIFRKDEARYNAMRMNQAIKNIEYGIRQKERTEDRAWQNERFDKQQDAINARLDKQFAHSDANLERQQEFRSSEAEKAREHAEGMISKRAGVQDWLAKRNYDRSISLAKEKLAMGVGSGSSSGKPYVQVMGDDGVAVGLNQGQYNFILSEMIKDPDIKETIDGMSVSSDNFSKNRLNIIIQQYANRYFDLRNGQVYPKGVATSQTTPKEERPQRSNQVAYAGVGTPDEDENNVGGLY